MTMYEIHVLMNYPANCLNRDDTGSPKTVVFNGTERIRISSQALKRSWRTSKLFSEYFGNIAFRTRGLPELVANELKNRNHDDEYILTAKKIISTDKKRKNEALDSDPWMMDKMEFYSAEEVKMIADAVEHLISSTDDKKEIAKFNYADVTKECKGKRAGITVDQAMFGRMVTDETVGEVDAAVQVAHAFSTNTGALESDYFVAIDDLIANGTMDGAASAGHMNTSDYDSSCFYEHVVIDEDQLMENLHNSSNLSDLCKNVCANFVKVMAFTAPSAKQNTFEAHVVPEAIYVEEKEDKIPVNLCNAFDVPARKNVAQESVKKLASEIDRVKSVYAIPSKHSIWLKTREEYAEPESKEVTVVTTLNDMLSKLSDWSNEE